jgi:hypothetical protein
VGGDVLSTQTTAQVLRCFDLGGYAATVEGGELKIRGPQPLAGPLPGSIKANRDDLVAFLEEWGGGVWPPAREPVSGLREVMEVLDCGLAFALDVLETTQRRAA